MQPARATGEESHSTPSAAAWDRGAKRPPDDLPVPVKRAGQPPNRPPPEPKYTETHQPGENEPAQRQPDDATVKEERSDSAERSNSFLSQPAAREHSPSARAPGGDL